MTDFPLLTNGGMIFIGLYLACLLLLGWVGKRAQQENSLSDFYLAGREVPLLVLFLTLYATQYSGNTLVGFSAKSYREGYWFLVSVVGMLAIIGGYLIYAPKLYRLSRKHKFITPGDFIQWRYGSTKLTVLTSIICIVATANYILTNLKAIGYIVEASTGGAVPFVYGIIVLAIIMVIYETLGGLRSVAWTDAIQGILILLGCSSIFVLLEVHYGGISEAGRILVDRNDPIWDPPEFKEKITWVSTTILFMCGITMYPHAIQRIYAAKCSSTLKRSLQLMVIMPFFTTLLMLIVGIVGAAQFPGLSKLESEQIIVIILGDLAQHYVIAKVVITIFIAATLAAIMSTVDSALLSISSVFTQDLFRRTPLHSSKIPLTTIGKYCSWIVMALMVWAAVVLPQTIWRLIEIKLEIFCQLSPCIFLGVQKRPPAAKVIMAGLLAGLAVTLGLNLFNYLELGVAAKPLGVHRGIWGLAVNFAIVTSLSKSQSRI